MRYRKLSPTGDYTFGQGPLNFYRDQVEAVAQAVKTRLQLYRASFWRDLNAGIPMMQGIAGTPGSPQNLAGIEATLQTEIRTTEGVLALLDSSVSFDSQTREYTYQALIQTQYSTTVITGTL